MRKIKLLENEILVLRTSDEDGKSHDGFQWPSRGRVSAPDWNGKPNCGGGLHGLPRGCGDGSLLNWDNDATAQLVIVDASRDYLEFDEKCKFKSGRVVFSKRNAFYEAIEILCTVYPDLPIVGRRAAAGDGGTATAGYFGTATAGDCGTATAGYFGTATAGYCGTAAAGDYGTATAGDYGTAAAGDYGTATAGDYGTAAAGDGGTAAAGYGGTATAGDYGILVIKWRDANRYRISVGYVGEDGIEPNKKYKLNNVGQFILAD